MKSLITFLLILLTVVACRIGETPVEEKVTALDGRVFRPSFSSAAAKAKLDSNVSVAQARFDDDPSEENTIWLGRREAYRMNYLKAIQIFTKGLEAYPDSYKLLRHRGHRYITIRQFDNAIADFSRAAQKMPSALEVEPDGIPNKQNIPLSNVQFNVYYHLGLAHYLKGDFDKALGQYVQCMNASDNDDSRCATADWMYMTLRRLGRVTEANTILATIRDSMNIIENDSYFKRLQMYKGALTPEQVLAVDSLSDDPDLAIATQGYGVGNWYLYNGDTTRAIAIFQKVVDGKHFSSFGFIAAEADLRRLKPD